MSSLQLLNVSCSQLLRLTSYAATTGQKTSHVITNIDNTTATIATDAQGEDMAE